MYVSGGDDSEWAGRFFFRGIFIALSPVALVSLLKGKVTQRVSQFWFVGLLLANGANVVLFG